MSQQSYDVRKEVRALIKRRGRRKYNVWTGYANKGGFRFALDGTPNTLHLIWMEGDPEVVEYKIPSERMIGKGNEGPQASIPDAICHLRSGKIQFREVKTDEEAEAQLHKSSDQVITQISAADAYSVEWRLITTKELSKHAMLIKNWRKGLAYLWAASDFDLGPFAYDIKSILITGKAMSLKQILDTYPSKNESLLIAAFFQLVQQGELHADLTAKPFGYRTIVQGRR
jgi:hypothetical protein